MHLFSSVKIRFLSVFLVSLLVGMLTSHCCSFVIPQISLTGNKTAIEKQIMGENTELEKDIWMISSSRTIKDQQNTEEQKQTLEKRNQENAKINEGFAIIDAFAGNLEILKRDKVVGENNQGFLSNLLEEKGVVIEENIKKKYDPSLKEDRLRGRDYRTLVETVTQINIAREMLLAGFMERQLSLDPKFKADRRSLLEEQRKKYHGEALKGEYIQQQAGQWLQK